MKNRFISIGYIALVGAALSGAALATEPGTTRTPVGDIKWLDTGFGPQASPVVGDFTKGKHVSLIKFKAGFKTPLHTHSHDYVGIVVTGKARHFEPGKPETETVLTPGSTWSVKGNVPHISECLDGEDCIFALSQDAAFDIHPVQ
jgi:quercetin dioxygenase-like cupin family protein